MCVGIAGRTYHCRAYDGRAPRDGVGAVNILNKGMHSGEIRPRECLVPERITDRRPMALNTSRRSPAEPREIAGGISSGESGGSLPGSHNPRCSHGGSPRTSARYGGEVQRLINAPDRPIPTLPVLEPTDWEPFPLLDI
jgi:putative transposase